MRARVDAILAAMTGRVWPEGSIRGTFEAAVEAARLDAPFRFHDCRHHFTTWFMVKGGSLLALQKILGRSSFAMTMRYAHLSPDHLRSETAKTERAAALEPDAGRREAVGTERARNDRVYRRKPG